MKKVFFGIAALAIAAVTVFTVNASTLAISPAYVQTGAGCVQLSPSTSGLFEDSGTTPAEIRDNGGILRDVYSDASCNTPAFFIP